MATEKGHTEIAEILLKQPTIEVNIKTIFFYLILNGVLNELYFNDKINLIISDEIK